MIADADLAACVQERDQLQRTNATLDRDHAGLWKECHALGDELKACRNERDKWLEAFNRSDQFQNGPTKRAEKAEAERDRLRGALADLRTVIEEHQRCNSYDCGNCVAFIAAELPPTSA